MLKRNDPCWCGSTKKYKKCHMDQDARYFARQRDAERDACTRHG